MLIKDNLHLTCNKNLIVYDSASIMLEFCFSLLNHLIGCVNITRLRKSCCNPSVVCTSSWLFIKLPILFSVSLVIGSFKVSADWSRSLWSPHDCSLNYVTHIIVFTVRRLQTKRVCLFAASLVIADNQHRRFSHRFSILLPIFPHLIR